MPEMMSDPSQTHSLSAVGTDLSGASIEELLAPDPYNKKKLVELFNRFKKESMDNRWIHEKEWTRDIWYILNRQWISFNPSRREWVDKRLHKWIPRPVTNKMAETLQSIRTNLAAINLSVKARPISNDPKSVAAAQIVDQMAPLVHEEHLMDQVMREADFWLIATGNAVLYAGWDLDRRSNRMFVPNEQCSICGQVSDPQVIIKANNACPNCGSSQFQPATNPDGSPAGEWISFGKGKTTALSPFEYSVPGNVTRWDDIPYLIRVRWRDKHWYEANAPELVGRISWEKTPKDRSLQLFKALATANDLGVGSSYSFMPTSTNQTVEGITEYEVWMKPTPEYPEGLVFRVAGESDPLILDLPNENLPGAFPAKDVNGTPIFPFVHAQYEHVGGRLLGRSAISPLIQKQDQLNQIDSLIQLIIQRMANPIWLVPEGAGVEHFSGEPGLIMKWNPLAAGGQAKPERIQGVEVPQSLQMLRGQILKDIEELSGAFDIIKGQKPTGVEAFSALQLLVERSQSRFTSVFQARGEMYRRWFAIAIELERQYGPNERVWTIVGPNKGYTFKHFENAQLQGQLNFILEDGSNMPKTALGKRAAIEQANQLGLLNPQDPDQRFALLSDFGLSDLIPTMNYHVQAALQIQDTFERWAQNPQGPSPLVVKPWFDPQIHWTERIKWLNTDRMRELIAQNPQLEQFIMFHLQELSFAMMPATQQAPPGAAGADGGLAMSNSNQNSASLGGLPSGNSEVGPNVGPA